MPTCKSELFLVLNLYCRSRLHVPGEGEQAKLSLEEPPLPSPGRGYLDTTADNPPPPLQFYDQVSVCKVQIFIKIINNIYFYMF